MKRTFSIIVNTYNRAHTLERTLQSLRNLRHDAYEVVVVNGPSSDETQKILERYTPLIRVGHCNEANLSKSRNIGIAIAAGEIVCFLDDDAVSEPNWLNELEIGYSEDNVAAVGGYIRDHTGYTYQSKALTCNRFGVSTDNESPEVANVNIGPMPETYLSLTGTNCSFRRKVLIEIGGFDEEFAYFLDETDVIVRLVDAGHKVKYVPTAEIHHKYSASHLRSAERIPKSIYLTVRSKAYFCIKNAAPKHSMDTVFRHLENYRKNLRRDYDWYLHKKKIDIEHHKRLYDDIDLGITHGVSDGSHPRKLLTEELVRKLAGPFKPVKLIRPVWDRLKICLLSQDYPPIACGGIGVWTHELAVGLAAEGHEVTVITRGGDYPTVDFEQGVWVHRIVPIRQPNRRTPILPNLAPVIRNYAYTVYDEVMRVHVLRGLDCISAPIWDLEGAACISDGSIPTVLSLHSTYKLVLPTKQEWIENPKYLNEHVYKMIKGEVWALSHATHVLANTKAIVKDIENAYGAKLQPDRLSVVPHGIAPDRAFDPESDARQLESKTREIRLLYVGRFEKRKGIDTLLEALPELLRNHQNLTVDLIGDSTINFDGSGPIIKTFSTRFHSEKWFNRIRLHGVVSNEILLDFYRKADIVVAPSRYESFGLIYLEAMRCGKPCIGTTAGGIAEVVTNEQSGLLVPPDNACALTAAIEKLVLDSRLRKDMGQAGYTAYLNRFTTARMVKECEQVYATAARQTDLPGFLVPRLT